eukprot:snap_masked-scaffold_27-processed-gene-0.29-mRNA-1 protein AED:1.00 eAED:1.00 QI:0/0/0/0/1/1/2/0/454
MNDCPSLEHPVLSDTTRNIILLIYLICMVPMPFLFTWFVFCRTWCEPLKKRSLFLAGVKMIAPGTVFMIREYIGRANMSCFFTKNFFLFGFTLGLYCDIASGLVFYAHMKRSKFLGGFYLSMAKTKSTAVHTTSMTEVVVSKVDLFERVFFFFFFPKNLSTYLGSTSTLDERKQPIRKLKRFNEICSQRYCARLYIIFTTITATAQFLTIGFNSCVGCELPWNFQFKLFIAFFPILIALGIIGGKIEKQPDPTYLIAEFRSVSKLFYAIGICCVLSLQFDIGGNYRSGRFSMGNLFGVLDAIYFHRSVSFPIYLAYKWENGKHKDAQIELNEFLTIEGGLECLKAHLIEEFALENFLLYETLVELKYAKQLPKCAEYIRHQEQSLKQYFLVDDASIEVNLSQQMRQQIIKQINKSNLRIGTIEEAMQEALDYVTNESFPRFLNSRKYKAFIDAL